MTLSRLPAKKGSMILSDIDIKKIKAMASYLAKIHSIKKDSKTLTGES